MILETILRQWRRPAPIRKVRSDGQAIAKCVFTAVVLLALTLPWTPGTAEAQVVIFQEDWETGFGDWWSDAGVWEVGAPTSGPDTAYGGTQCAATILAGNYPFNIDSRLISPSIDLDPIAGNEEIVLRFQQHFNWAAYSDNGKVQVQVYDEGAGLWSEWTTLVTFTLYTPVWHRARVDLSAYAGMRVRIGYLHDDVYEDPDGITHHYEAPGWYLDDVEVVRQARPLFSGSDDFESGWDGWYSDRGIWQLGEPTSGPNSAFSGTNCMATILDGDYPFLPDSRLISPEMVLEPIAVGEEIVLRFQQYFDWYPISDNGKVQVQVYDEGTGTWSEWTTLWTYSQNSGGWHHARVDMSTYRDRRVRIGFLHDDVYEDPDGITHHYEGPGWYIDDVQVINIGPQPPTIHCPAGPVAASLCSPDTVCVALSINSADSIGVSPPSAWYDGAGRKLCFVAASPGRYEFEVVATNSAGAGTCDVTVDVEILEAPTACFTPTSTAGESPLEVAFSSSCSVPERGLTYLWRFGDGDSSTARNPRHTYTDVGCYTVTLVVMNDCAADTFVVADAVCVREAPTARLYFVPDSAFLMPASRQIPTSVELWCDSSEPVLGIHASVQFDPSRVRVTEMAPGPYLERNGGTITNLSTVDNDRGSLIVSLTTIGGRPQGVAASDAVMAITFQAVAQDPTSEVVFASASLRDSLNREIPVTTENGSLLLADCLLGDFDSDDDVDFFDYTIFVSCWNDGNVGLCDICGPITGPHPGNPPYMCGLYPYPSDGVIDFEDQVVFSLMYNWSNQFGSGGMAGFGRNGPDIAVARPAGLRVPTVGPNGAFTVSWSLPAVADLIGARFVLEFDKQALELVATNLDELLSSDKNVVSNFDRATEAGQVISRTVLGPRVALSERATVEVSFRALKADGRTEIRLRDVDLRAGANRRVRIDGDSFAQPWEVVLGSAPAVREFQVLPNDPNPFKGSTTLRFAQPRSGNVRIDVFSVTGSRVATVLNRHMEAGMHSVVWDGRDHRGHLVPGGIYFYSVVSGEFRSTRRMVVLR